MENQTENNNIERTVLIVDDKQINIDFLSNSIKREGYRVISARTAEAAIKIAISKSPDIILLDAHMPDRSGFDISNDIKNIEELANIPIIFMISKKDNKIFSQCFASGGADYVCKPINIQVLINRMKTHIELRELRENLIPPSKRRKKQKPLSELIKMVSF